MHTDRLFENLAPEAPVKEISMYTWLIGPIKSPTLVRGEQKANNIHQCPFCHILLLTSERPGFCCGKDGQYLNTVPPLPPLPQQYGVFLDDPQISSCLRILNLIFSFASLETTHQRSTDPQVFSPFKAECTVESVPAIPIPPFIGFCMTVSFATKFRIPNGLL